jgi:hypothetical protein
LRRVIEQLDPPIFPAGNILDRSKNGLTQRSRGTRQCHCTNDAPATVVGLELALAPSIFCGKQTNHPIHLAERITRLSTFRSIEGHACLLIAHERRFARLAGT